MIWKRHWRRSGIAALPLAVMVLAVLPLLVMILLGWGWLQSRKLRKNLRAYEKRSVSLEPREGVEYIPPSGFEREKS